MFIINTFSTCFGHHYSDLQETKTCVTERGVLRWYCWMWLVAVVGRCVVGCEHCEGYCRTVTFTVLAPHNAAPQNRYQPHPAVPAQHTTFSNTRLGLLKMGVMMPETVASCWFSLSLHNLLHFFHFIPSMFFLSTVTSLVLDVRLFAAKCSLIELIRRRTERLFSHLKH